MQNAPLSMASLTESIPHGPFEVMPNLTPKEQEILSWCAQGKTTAEIAIILNKSETTINFHIANLRMKFGVSSRHAAVLKAIKLGQAIGP